MSVKIKVFRNWELDDTGVTPVWTRKCDSAICEGLGISTNSTLFWENAIRCANIHIKYHEQFYRISNA